MRRPTCPAANLLAAKAWAAGFDLLVMRAARGEIPFLGYGPPNGAHGERRRIVRFRTCDSIRLTARHPDGRAFVALWVHHPTWARKPRGKTWARALYGGRTRSIKKHKHALPALLALLPHAAVELFVLDQLEQWGVTTWSLDMAHRPGELTPLAVTATELTAYVLGPATEDLEDAA